MSSWFQTNNIPFWYKRKSGESRKIVTINIIIWTIIQFLLSHQNYINIFLITNIYTLIFFNMIKLSEVIYNHSFLKMCLLIYFFLGGGGYDVSSTHLMSEMLENHENDGEKPQKKKIKLSSGQETNNSDISVIKVPILSTPIIKINVSKYVCSMLNCTNLIFLFCLSAHARLIKCVSQSTVGRNWIKVACSGYNMQSSWTQTR